MARTRALALAAALACALLAAPAARAQAPVDVSGFWELQTSVFTGQRGEFEGQPDCAYRGSADVTQDGSDLGGTSRLTLESGNLGCPAQMTADIDGQITGNTLEMGMLMGGQLGTAQWAGTVSPAFVEGTGVTGGDFFVDSGPFSGSGGTWSAQRGQPPVLTIPTLTRVGLVVLVVLLLGAAGLLLRRRSAEAT